MEEKASGIVLSCVNYGESDRILNIFTLEKGVVSARIKGVKKAGAKLKFASEPFCFAEFIFLVSGEKRTVINASLIDSFYPIRENIRKYFAGGAALEFIKKFLKQDIVSVKAFALLADALKTLAYANKEPLGVLAAFLLNGLSLAGYGLLISENCAACGKQIESRPFFDYAGGRFLCTDCGDGCREINYATLVALGKAERGERLTEEEGRFALRLIDFYLNVKAEENLVSLKELIKLS